MSHVYSNPHNNPLTLKTALPPLDSDMDEDDEQGLMDGHFISIFASAAASRASPDHHKSSTASSDKSSATNNSKLLSHPPHPQHEEQHPSKKVETEIDSHPSKKLEPKPQQLQQPLHYWQPHNHHLYSTPTGNENDDSNNHDDGITNNNGSQPQNYKDYLAYVHASSSGAAAAAASPSKDNHKMDHSNNMTPTKSTTSHESSTMADNRSSSSRSTLSHSNKRRNSSRIQQTVALYERCLPDTTLRYTQPSSSSSSSENDANNNKRKSGSLVAGGWSDSPSQLIFWGDEDSHTMATAATTTAETSTVISGSTTNAVVANNYIKSISNNKNNPTGTPCHEIRVEPREETLEGARLSGNWRDDLQATRLEFVVADDNETCDTADNGNSTQQNKEQDNDDEIQVAPRKSKPVVFRGNLKEHMRSADLIFRSKADLHLLTPQHSSESSALESSSAASPQKSASPQKITPQRKSLPRQHDITVEPLLISSPASHCGKKDAAPAAVAKEAFHMPLDDDEIEIKVEPRHSKPVVLQGDLKEYLNDLSLRSHDDVNVVTGSDRRRAGEEITVEPMDTEIRRIVSEDVSDIMPLDDEENEITVEPRRSKPTVLRGNLKDYMQAADLFFQSSDDLSRLQAGDVDAAKEIVVEPREGESLFISGDLKSYVQNAAKVFHESIRDSTLVYHDTVEASASENKQVEDDDGDDDDEDTDADALNISIDSMREELALAEQSFETSFETAVSMMSAETMRTANVSTQDNTSLTPTPEKETKPIHLPFPWDNPNVMFEAHNGLKAPPGDAKYYMQPEKLEEKLRQQLFTTIEEEPRSMPQEETELDFIQPNLGAPDVKPDDLPPSLSPEPPFPSSDYLQFKNSNPSPNSDDEPPTVSPDDIAILYRGENQPPTTRRKSVLATIASALSSSGHSHSIDDSFCVDCGGPTTRCYCDVAVEDDRYIEMRMESVYSSTLEILYRIRPPNLS